MIDLPFIDPKRGTAHPQIVGQSAYNIAKLSGFDIPETSKSCWLKDQKLIGMTHSLEKIISNLDYVQS